ncbi:MAG: terminase [Sphingomonas bacterium]|uniref:helix-turn-helix domain-containing protein n=1 Tax=Sphingomonas bacterium TaxID=1895847 RepID=UPI00262DC9A3|nr:helix-turn-helix domain-containing protein [Sphingomonas bacterium]MDB5705135.1 terminase [Sphingomonas bacterium]
MPAGRPSPYRPEHADQARKLCRNGMTDREVADILGISPRTFYRWCGEHDDFADAVRVGKDRADERVERALYQRAVGYDYEDVKVFAGGAKGPVIVPVTVHVPADVRAGTQWLRCRQPDAWSGKPEPEEDEDLARRIEEGWARVQELNRERAIEEAARFEQRVAEGIAAALAQRGLS